MIESEGMRLVGDTQGKRPLKDLDVDGVILTRVLEKQIRLVQGRDQWLPALPIRCWGGG
jgi:hypothetical protein